MKRMMAQEKHNMAKFSVGKKRFEHVIRYDDGVRVEHVLASSAVPIFYKYKEINGESGDNSNTIDTRAFWDGILFSNTPLRQLINEHQDFWENKIEDTNLLGDMWETDNGQKRIRKVPDLDVYIVDIWPTKKDAIPANLEESLDRMNDIMSNDKTDYDEVVATFVSDYIDFVKQMRNLSAEAINEIPNSNNNKKKTLQRKLEDIPKKVARSTKRTGERRLYQDLIKGRFNLNKVVRIERKEDDDAISKKWQDFSSVTIRQLIDNGYKEGSFQMDVYFQMDKVRDLVKDAKLNQHQADNFIHNLLKIRRNYLTLRKEDVAINDLQKTANEIQSIT